MSANGCKRRISPYQIINAEGQCLLWNVNYELVSKWYVFILCLAEMYFQILPHTIQLKCTNRCVRFRWRSHKDWNTLCTYAHEISHTYLACYLFAAYFSSIWFVWLMLYFINLLVLPSPTIVSIQNLLLAVVLQIMTYVHNFLSISRIFVAYFYIWLNLKCHTMAYKKFKQFGGKWHDIYFIDSL